MSIFPTKAHRLIPFCFALLVTFSCSKDSDLLADYVSPDGIDAGIRRFVVDDTFVVSVNASIRLDVLSNDNFPDKKKVRITGTSNPRSGSVSINEDNTITYTPEVEEPTTATPEAEESTTDEFTYTTEVVNEDQTVSAEEGTVTIEVSPVTVELSGENIYYVTTGGTSGNDGHTEATAWSIEKAFASAMAGDIVYIKAGNYGNKKLVVNNSGTSASPIKFIGYTNTPGDLVSNQGSTFKYGDALDASKMPLLEGSPLNGLGLGTAILIRKSNIHIENLQITKYENGLVANGQNSIFKNIIVTQMGDYDPLHTYPLNTVDQFLNYSGKGIFIEGNNSKLLNSFVLNSGAQGVTFKNGSNFQVDYVQVYADSPINPTDYYFLIADNTANSRFNQITSYRVGELLHNGHGIVFKGNGEVTGNTLENFNIVNTVLELQFPNVYNNTCKNGQIFKEANINNSSPEVGGMNLANGAHNNLFEDIDLTNCYIKFLDWDDGLSGDVADSSDNNTFNRISVQDASAAIAFGYFHVNNHTSSADNNSFNNCTFKNIDHLFEVDRANSNTTLSNCLISNVKTLSKERITGAPTYTIDINYDNCNWEIISFNPPN